MGSERPEVSEQVRLREAREHERPWKKWGPRGPDAATLHLLPTLWFRNTWSWGDESAKPTLLRLDADRIQASHAERGDFTLQMLDESEFLSPSDRCYARFVRARGGSRRPAHVERRPVVARPRRRRGADEA